MAAIERLEAERLSAPGSEHQCDPDAISFVAGAAKRAVELAVANAVSLEGIAAPCAHLKDATLVDADLAGARLVGANLSAADLTGADLGLSGSSGADLERAHLVGTTLVRADLRNARLVDAVLTGSDLTDADVGDADLTSTDLSCAIMTTTRNLTQEQLDQACGQNVRLPPGLRIERCAAAEVVEHAESSSRLDIGEIESEGSRTHEPETGHLVQGAAYAFGIELEQGTDYLIYGECDYDCRNLDLTLRDSDGRVVSEDVLPDDVPLLSFAPESSGVFEVTVAMAVCLVEPCAWIVHSRVVPVVEGQR